MDSVRLRTSKSVSAGLVSRRGHVYKAFGPLAAAIAHTLQGHSAILDGEVVRLNERGEPQFTKLLFRREHALVLCVRCAVA